MPGILQDAYKKGHDGNSFLVQTLARAFVAQQVFIN